MGVIQEFQILDESLGNYRKNRSAIIQDIQLSKHRVWVGLEEISGRTFIYVEGKTYKNLKHFVPSVLNKYDVKTRPGKLLMEYSSEIV